MGNSQPDVWDFVYRNQGTETKATCHCCGQEMAAAMTDLHKKLCPPRLKGREESGSWLPPRLRLWLKPT
jgi:hypothetical protein